MSFVVVERTPTVLASSAVLNGNISVLKDGRHGLTSYILGVTPADDATVLVVNIIDFGWWDADAVHVEAVEVDWCAQFQQGNVVFQGSRRPLWVLKIG